MNLIYVSNYFKNQFEKLDTAMHFIENLLDCNFTYTNTGFNSFYIDYNKKRLDDTYTIDNVQSFILSLWKILSENERTKIYNQITEFEKTKEVLEKNYQNKIKEIVLDNIPLSDEQSKKLNTRLKEVCICLENKANLSAIIMIGSTLEGILFALAKKYTKEFNKNELSPKDKDTDKVKPLEKWTFENFLQVACNLKILKENNTKFVHTLKEFRNYIHPSKEFENISPDEHTATISFEILKSAINDINEYIKNQNPSFIRVSDILSKFAGNFENASNKYLDAHVELILTAMDRITIKGFAIAGALHIGEMEDIDIYGYDDYETISYQDNEDGYQLIIKIIDKNTIDITEKNFDKRYGHGVSFNDIYKKIE